jgi:hypothetical protein
LTVAFNKGREYAEPFELTDSVSVIVCSSEVSVMVASTVKILKTLAMFRLNGSTHEHTHNPIATVNSVIFLFITVVRIE